jgi:hypothetical protein
MAKLDKPQVPASGSGEQRAGGTVLAEVAVKNVPTSKVHDRITAARVSLEHIDRERTLRCDPLFGKALEERIVRRELFDLELQELDEQTARICESARSLSVGLPGSTDPTVTTSSKPHSP